MARPTKYKPEFCKEAEEACATKGATVKILSQMFKVNPETVYDWMRKKPEFSDAVTRGRDLWNTKAVEEALIKRSLGENVTEETITYNADGSVKEKKTVAKYIPPDTKAITFYLPNRDPDRWKHVLDTNVNVTNLTDLIKLIHKEKHEDSDVEKPGEDSQPVAP